MSRLSGIFPFHVHNENGNDFQILLKEDIYSENGNIHYTILQLQNMSLTKKWIFQYSIIFTVILHEIDFLRLYKFNLGSLLNEGNSFQLR